MSGTARGPRSALVRAEEPADRDAVRDVHRRAFGGEHGRAVAELVDALRTAGEPGDMLSLVAEDGREVVGHVMFTTSLLDAPPRLVRVQVLSPLAVVPERQGRGIGAALVRHGLEILDRRSVPLVFLEGDPSYYERFGFAAGGELGFRRPSLRIPEAGFQAVRLSAYEGWMTGTLVYAETFWRHDVVGLRDDDA